MTDKNKALLDKIRMPGSTFKLPSNAKFYSNDVVELEKGKAEVYLSPMTTMDELAITAVDKLLNGTAIDEVFLRCAPAIKAPRDMLARDIDYLVIALRVISFGAVVDIKYRHGCTDSKEHTYEVDVEKMLLDPSVSLSDEALTKYHVNLSNGVHIKLHPMTYGSLLFVQEILDEIVKINQQLQATTSPSDRAALATKANDAAFRYYKARTLSVISEMDGVTDPETLDAVIGHLALPLRTELLTALDTIESWGPPSEVTLTCKDCQKPMEVMLDLNPVGFFTPRSSKGTTS